MSTSSDSTEIPKGNLQGFKAHAKSDIRHEIIGGENINYSEYGEDQFHLVVRID